jgi:hypothetical protein
MEAPAKLKLNKLGKIYVKPLSRAKKILLVWFAG